MARTKTRLQMLTAARQLADQGNSTFITDAAANYQIDQFVAALWSMLVAQGPDRYVTTGDIATTTGTRSYALESDFMSVRRVERVEGDDAWPLNPFTLQEKGRYSGYPGFGNTSTVRYRIMGQGIDGSDAMIWFDPDPGTHTYRVWYVQAPPLLATDGAAFDGVAGFESWVETRLAIWMREREESDTSGLRADLAQIESMIRTLAGQRDAGSAPQVANVRRRRHQGHWRTSR